MFVAVISIFFSLSKKLCGKQLLNRQKSWKETKILRFESPISTVLCLIVLLCTGREHVSWWEQTKQDATTLILCKFSSVSKFCYPHILYRSLCLLWGLPLCSKSFWTKVLPMSGNWWCMRSRPGTPSTSNSTCVHSIFKARFLFVSGSPTVLVCAHTSVVK